MSIIDIVFFWHILAWVAVALRCHYGESDVLTICQMFLVMLLWPWALFVVALALFGVGIALAHAEAQANVIFLGKVMGAVGAGAVIIWAAAFGFEYAKECRIIWRRR